MPDILRMMIGLTEGDAAFRNRRITWVTKFKLSRETLQDEKGAESPFYIQLVFYIIILCKIMCILTL